jgi:hypothetical protein
VKDGCVFPRQISFSTIKSWNDDLLPANHVQMLTDLIVYDWWPLILGFAGELDEINKNDERREKQIKWVGELMEEQNVKALPRSSEVLGRCYDSREFWQTFGVWPARARI